MHEGGSRGERTPGKGATMGEMSSRIAQRYFAKRLVRGKLSFIGDVEAPQNLHWRTKGKIWFTGDVLQVISIFGLH